MLPTHKTVANPLTAKNAAAELLSWVRKICL